MKSILSEEVCSVRLPREVQKKRLQRVLREELTEHQRQTLIAYYFQEQSVPEIARNRGGNKTTVWRTLRRAEERLQRYLRY